ncbi:MAG: polysaccharide deacetylase family protein [Cellulomonas sp.]
MVTPQYWKLREQLGPRGRQRVRAAVDAVVAPVLGSVRATGATTRAAITFDDGPDPEVTPRLLAALAEAGVTCTFFVLVVQARRRPDLVRALSAAGHEVALHGDDHRRLTELGHRAAHRCLVTARDELQSLSGTPVRYYRPPYGAQSVASYLAARRARLEVVVWSADADDWTDRPVEQVVQAGLTGLAGGGILLLHERLEPDPRNGAPTTSFDRIDMARRVIAGARERGWEPGTVGELVRTGGARRTAWFRP